MLYKAVLHVSGYLRCKEEKPTFDVHSLQVGPGDT